MGSTEYIILVLAIIVVGLWIFSGRQKRKFDDESRKRRREREKLVAKDKASKSDNE